MWLLAYIHYIESYHKSKFKCNYVSQFTFFTLAIASQFTVFTDAYTSQLMVLIDVVESAVNAHHVLFPPSVLFAHAYHVVAGVAVEYDIEK